MMIEDLGETQMMIEFPGVEMMIGELGVIWMTIDSLDVVKMTEFPGVVMIQDLVFGDQLANQVAGESERKQEKKAGLHLESLGHQKTVNGIETKKGIETKIVKKMIKNMKEREMEIVKIVSGGLEMKLDGEDQLRKPQVGEILIAVMNGIEMTVVVVTEMIEEEET